MTPDPYRTLQVEPNADLEAIHAAYRRLARLYHPDRNPLPEAAAQMRAINAAYAVLADPRRRAAYDAQRYLSRSHRPRVTVVARPQPVAWRPAEVRVEAVAAHPPTTLQRRVDRVVAVVGVLLLIAIGFYTVSVIPYAERQFQAERLGYSDRPARQAPLTSATASEHDTGVGVPERLRSDANLRSFPGPVLVAPMSLEPFASLPVLRLDANGLGIARYAVYYGDLTTGGATISGLVGRASFDASAPRLPDCAADAAYCAGLVAGQSPGPPGLELFRAPDLVEDYPAFVTHRVCCNGVMWSLSWYEPRANMSYTIDLSRSVATRFGSPAAEADLGAARAVAALAPQLVRLP
jgi:hypothetical protein